MGRVVRAHEGKQLVRVESPHDAFTIAMLLYLIPHVLLGALVPWSWPLLRSMFTGYVTQRYAKQSHANWIQQLETERKGD